MIKTLVNLRHPLKSLKPGLNSTHHHLESIRILQHSPYLNSYIILTSETIPACQDGSIFEHLLRHEAQAMHRVSETVQLHRMQGNQQVHGNDQVEQSEYIRTEK